MESGVTSQKFPANREAWEALVAEAPGDDRPATAEEDAAWAGGVLVREGGYPAVQARRDHGSAAALLQRLRDNPPPPECRRREEEIDAQIEQERNAWE